MTRTQWETLERIIENPYKDGIITILLKPRKVDGLIKWEIKALANDRKQRGKKGLVYLDYTGGYRKSSTLQEQLDEALEEFKFLQLDKKLEEDDVQQNIR